MSQRRLEQTFKNSSESLASIFNDYNYDSVFLGPHPAESKLYLYMKATGFTNVRTSDDYKDAKKHYPDLSDHDIFNFLSEIVDDEMRRERNFFISMYNVETHHGMTVKDHIYANGENDFYNKFYNFDYWLGNFISWFNSSKVSDDTVLVITADHCTYAVPLFEDTFRFKSHSKSMFVDKVPFIVYKKGIVDEALVINAHGRNSLCLAPTLLDLIGLDGVKNHFLGNSLFDDNGSEFEHLSLIGADSIVTSENEYHDIELKSEIKEKLDDYFGFSG